MDNQFNFENLSVYKKSLVFTKNVYKITATYPDIERFGLVSQFRRAALSIGLNIAEGSGDSNYQFIRYLKISKGSIRECIVCLTISNQLEYISKETEQIFREDLVEISKMLSGLISSQNNKSEHS